MKLNFLIILTWLQQILFSLSAWRQISFLTQKNRLIDKNECIIDQFRCLTFLSLKCANPEKYTPMLYWPMIEMSKIVTHDRCVSVIRLPRQMENMKHDEGRIGMIHQWIETLCDPYSSLLSTLNETVHVCTRWQSVNTNNQFFL